MRIGERLQTIFFVFLVVLTYSEHVCASTKKPTQIKLQLFWYHQFEFAGFYAAKEKGFFKQYGLAVEFIEFSRKTDTTQVILNKDAHFGLAGSELINNFHNGDNVKLIASYFKSSPLTIITQPDITSLKDLAGTTLYGRDIHLQQGSIRGMLDLYGISTSDFNITSKGDRVELFRKGKVSGVLAFKTNFPYTLNNEGIKFRLYDPNQFGMLSQDMNLFTSAKFSKEHPEVVANFAKAVKKGWLYAIENKSELVEIIKEKYNTQNLERDALTFEANEVIKLIAPELFSIGSIQPQKLEIISQESLSRNSVTELRNLKDFVFAPNSQAINNNAVFSLLNKEEKEYLSRHSVVRLQSEKDYPPFNYLVDQTPTGYSVDFAELLSQILGIEFEFVVGNTWSDSINMLKNKELDALINIINIESRRSFASFTQSYVEFYSYAVVRKDFETKLVDLDDLKNVRIALGKGYALNNSLRTIMPDGNFSTVDNVDHALKLISANEADIFIGAGAVLDYFMSKNGMSDLKLVPISPNLNPLKHEFSIATHKSNKTLLSLLKKAISLIPDSELMRLKRKWFGFNKITQGKTNNLSPLESKYIKSIPVVLCRPELKDGSNITVKIVDFINRNVGLKISLSQPMSWTEALLALENKECDLVASITKTKKRSETMNFTKGYFRDKVVVITKQGTLPIYDLSDHMTKTFAVLEGISFIEQLVMSYPNIKLIKVKFPREAIDLINENKVIGLIHTEVFSKILLNDLNLVDLKINSQLREQFDDIYSIATQKDNKLLHGILSKAVDSTNKADIAELINTNILQDKNDTQINFTRAELSYINSAKLRWCYSDNNDAWPEIIELITKDIDIQLVKSKLYSWHQALKALEEGECDLLPEATKTQERLKVMNFTDPIHNEERVIVTLDNQPFITNIQNFLDHEFVLHKGDTLYEQLKQEYPEIKIHLVEFQVEGLNMVKNGDAFAYMGSIADTGNTINKFALTNLKIAGSLPDKFNDSWSFATRKSDPIFSSIVQKLVEKADKKDIARIIANQLAVKYEKGFDYSLFWKLFIVVFLILGIVIYWNRRLAGLNGQLVLAKQLSEQAQKKVETKNKEILSAQKQLVQSEKMASLGTLTAGVAHEINNPTSFTYASVYMMQSEIEAIKAFLRKLAGGPDADPKIVASFDDRFEKLENLAKTACEGTKRIKEIVDDLSTFARLDDAKKAKVSVGEIISSTVHLVNTQYENINIQSTFDFDPLIYCFPSKLNQVFMNLIVNACQAIETKSRNYKEGKIKYEGRLAIASQIMDKHLIISFNDNGCGMTKTTKERIFEPFYTTKSPKSGTGLGMSVSLEVIQLHRGTMEISSYEGNGTEIIIKLPLE